MESDVTDDESRPFCKMEEALFYKITEERDYLGYLSLFVSNEPFMDSGASE